MLHTWDQKLLYHVHVHCVIAGGALACDGSRWLPASRNYLFPVRALSAAFRDRYLDGVLRACVGGKLVFPGRLSALVTAEAFQQWLQPLRQKDWVVYSQPPWGGAGQVLEYLSRYTHRIAISNHRLRQLEDGRVTFDYRDRRDGNEFIRRFLLHVLPPGFCRMRHYGFLGNRIKEEQLTRCRALLGPSTPVDAESAGSPLLLGPQTYVDPTLCPCCGLGRMVMVQRLPAGSEVAGGAAAPPAPAPTNSS